MGRRITPENHLRLKHLTWSGLASMLRRMKMLALLAGLFLLQTAAVRAASIHDIAVKDINGKDTSLKAYKGKVVLIVNVASQCGLTPQYKGLEKLYEKFKGKGFAVLGFPANNFGAQEPGTNEEIKTFCTRNYNVTFPMYSKISVKGADK